MNDATQPIELVDGEEVKLISDARILCEGKTLGTIYEDLHQDLKIGCLSLLALLELQIQE